MAEPMNAHKPRFDAYATKTDEGTLSYDVAGMAVDLIALVKIQGMKYEDFAKRLMMLWAEVEVKVAPDVVQREESIN